ncbi:MAG: hypothetical protein JRC91_02450 [Deltaproteobacteria bacterium]|nr:hypothetical protein [Deltaproteobacteria bacterium]
MEIKAFYDLNDSISNLSKSLTKFGVDFLILPSQLKIESRWVGFTLYDFIKPYLIGNTFAEIRNRNIDFISSIESHEIVFIEFDHYRKKLFLEIEYLEKEYKQFRKFLRNKKTNDLLGESNEEFKSKTDKIYNMSLRIQTFLLDYRVILMNQFLGEIFDKKIPTRKPRGDGLKPLNEIAIKRAVEKEFKEYENTLGQPKDD